MRAELRFGIIHVKCCTHRQGHGGQTKKGAMAQVAPECRLVASSRGSPWRVRLGALEGCEPGRRAGNRPPSSRPPGRHWHGTPWCVRLGALLLARRRAGSPGRHGWGTPWWVRYCEPGKCTAQQSTAETALAGNAIEPNGIQFGAQISPTQADIWPSRAQMDPKVVESGPTLVNLSGDMVELGPHRVKASIDPADSGAHLVGPCPGSVEPELGAMRQWDVRGVRLAPHAARTLRR